MICFPVMRCTLNIFNGRKGQTKYIFRLLCPGQQTIVIITRLVRFTSRRETSRVPDFQNAAMFLTERRWSAVCCTLKQGYMTCEFFVRWQLAELFPLREVRTPEIEAAAMAIILTAHAWSSMPLRACLNRRINETRGTENLLFEVLRHAAGWVQ